MSTGFMWMLIVCGTIQAALLVALIVYLWMLFATRHWLPADGTIVTSRVDSRGTDSVNGADTEIARTPLGVASYNGRVYRLRLQPRERLTPFASQRLSGR